MVVMEAVTEEDVSVHGGLDHTFLKRGGGTVGQFWPLGCQINSTLTFVIFCIRVDVLQCQ